MDTTQLEWSSILGSAALTDQERFNLIQAILPGKSLSAIRNFLEGPDAAAETTTPVAICTTQNRFASLSEDSDEEEMTIERSSGAAAAREEDAAKSRGRDLERSTKRKHQSPPSSDVEDCTKRAKSASTKTTTTTTKTTTTATATASSKKATTATAAPKGPSKATANPAKATTAATTTAAATTAAKATAATKSTTKATAATANSTKAATATASSTKAATATGNTAKATAATATSKVSTKATAATAGSSKATTATASSSKATAATASSSKTTAATAGSTKTTAQAAPATTTAASARTTAAKDTAKTTAVSAKTTAESTTTGPVEPATSGTTAPAAAATAATAAAAAGTEKNTTPVVLWATTMPRTLATQLKKDGVKFSAEPCRRTVAIKAATPSGHALLLKAMEDQNLQGYTYSSGPAATITRILKRISSEYSAAEVAEELSAESSRTVTVTEMSDRHGRRLDMFKVTATKSDMEEVMKCGIFGTHPRRMQWELPHRQEVVQCFRCQRFGHSARHCMMQSRCVKCSQSHARGSCQNTDRSSPAYCVNCGEMGHPANFRQCPKYLAAVEQMAFRKARNESIAEAKRNGVPSLQVFPGLSFSDAARRRNQQQRAAATQPAAQSAAEQPAAASPPQVQQKPQPVSDQSGNFIQECLNSTFCGIPITQAIPIIIKNIQALKATSSAEERGTLMVNIIMNALLNA